MMMMMMMIMLPLFTLLQTKRKSQLRKKYRSKRANKTTTSENGIRVWGALFREKFKFTREEVRKGKKVK